MNIDGSLPISGLYPNTTGPLQENPQPGVSTEENTQELIGGDQVTPLPDPVAPDPGTSDSQTLLDKLLEAASQLDIKIKLFDNPAHGADKISLKIKLRSEAGQVSIKVKQHVGKHLDEINADDIQRKAADDAHRSFDFELKMKVETLADNPEEHGAEPAAIAKSLGEVFRNFFDGLAGVFGPPPQPVLAAVPAAEQASEQASDVREDDGDADDVGAVSTEGGTSPEAVDATVTDQTAVTPAAEVETPVAAESTTPSTQDFFSQLTDLFFGFTRDVLGLFADALGSTPDSGENAAENTFQVQISLKARIRAYLPPPESTETVSA